MKRFSIVLIAVLFMTICYSFAEPYSIPIKEEFMTENLWFDSLNVRFVGNWPFGYYSWAIAYDSVRDYVFCGSAGGVYIFDVSNPSFPQKITDRIQLSILIFEYK